MSWLSFLDFLVEPAFIDRRRPPLGVAVPARVFGWIIAVVSLFFLLALLAVGIPALLHARIFLLALAGYVLLFIAQLGMLVGAWQMTRGVQDGRRSLIQALALTVVFSLVYNIGLTNIPQFILQLVIRLVIYYFALVSRFPEEAAASTS